MASRKPSPRALAFLVCLLSWAIALEIPNASFEKIQGGMPLSWTRWGGGALATCAATKEQARTGRACVKIVDRDPKAPVGIESALVAVVAGKNYRVRGQVFVRTGDAVLYLQFFSAGGKRIEKAVKTVQAEKKGEWTELSVSGPAPEDAVGLKLLFYSSSLNQGEFFVDDASCEECEPEPSQAEGPQRIARLPAPRLDRATALPTATRLIQGGVSACELLHPPTASGVAAARKIAAAVKAATGVELPFRAGTPTDRVPARHTLMLGNLMSNPALKVLYARQQTAVDEYLPGPGGYTVETIVEPFALGADVLVLGASEDAGLDLAADAFIRQVVSRGKPGSLELPILFETKIRAELPRPEFKKTHVADGLKDARTRLAEGAHTSLGGLLASIAGRYRLTRHPLDAELYVAVARLYAESAVADARKFGGPWGFDSDFVSYEALAGWDLIEHDPALSEADRLDVSRMLLRWLHEAIADEAWGGLGEGGPVSNHLTFASMGAMMGAFYFGKYYGAELKHPAAWLAVIRHNFRRQAKAGKAHDDCQSYHWLTWRHVLVYSMAMPDDRFFTEGVGRKVLMDCGVTMDNLATQAPYGDDGGWASSSGELIVLDMYFAATGDPLAAMLLGQKRSGLKTIRPGSFYGRVEAKTDATLDGVQVLPLDEGYYRINPGIGKVAPLAKCFDKFSFRERLDPGALYLLVDGVQNGGHRHADGNSVLRYSQFGREWLADGDYPKNQQKYHNSLLILKDGEAFPLPDYMELHARGSNADARWVTVRAAGTAPVDWLRHHIWLTGEAAWLVIDEVVALSGGRFRLTQRWNGVGEITMRPDGYLLEQKGSAVRFQGAADLSMRYYDDRDYGKPWAGYPYAKPVVRVMDQLAEPRLAPGERFMLAAVWHGASNGAPVVPWAVDRIPDGFSVATGKVRYQFKVAKDGVLEMNARADAGAVTEKTALRGTANAEIAPAASELWRISQEKEGPSLLTDGSSAAVAPFRITGTEPGAENILVAGVPNRLSALVDGSWSEGGDSVMFGVDQPVTLQFDFEGPQQIARAELRAWWANQSSRGTAYKLQEARVILSADGFAKDLRSVARLDARGERHGNFGTPVAFGFDFPLQSATGVRIELTPQPGTALYLGELSLFGKASLGAKREAPRAAFTKMLRLRSPEGERLIAGSEGGECFVYSLDGKPAGRLAFPSRINDLAACDVDGDGVLELLLACQDATLRAVKLDGKELWKVAFEKYRVYPDATLVKTADLDGDGKDEILVGCDNWRVYALDRGGRELWKYEVVHKTRALEVADLEGDGRPEILCGTSYMWATILDRQGQRRWGGAFGIGCRAIAAPLGGDGGGRRVVLGIDSGAVTFYDAKGGTLGQFFTGDEIFMLAAVRRGPGSEDVLAASYNGFIYRFSSEGLLRWSCALPDSAVVVRALPDGRAVAATIGGHVCVLSPEGKITAAARFEGRVSDLLVDGDFVRVATKGGALATIRP
ncbi:MAG: hypothetical protein J0L75_17705 [Spirochaetes bacterium]|nr:hypothetical protein [Spirochaetota bacterium]